MSKDTNNPNFERTFKDLQDRNDALNKKLEVARSAVGQDLAGRIREGHKVLEREISDYRHLILGVLHSLTFAIDAKDPYTAGHSSRVATLSVLIGKELDLDDDWLERLEYASLLHDIGKIGIPEEILLKNGKLEILEKDAMNKHPAISAQIIKPITFFADLVPIVRHHHERFNGGGYPDGLVGEEIPLGSRIIALCDAVDAMTTDRCYRKKLDTAKVISEIRTFSGTQFDPNVVDAFLRCHSRDPEIMNWEI